MKPQDILFFIVFAFLLTLRKPRWLVYAGLGSLTLAMPLFGFWIFFTAQRFTWYATAFFTSAVLQYLFHQEDHA